MRVGDQVLDAGARARSRPAWSPAPCWLAAERSTPSSPTAGRPGPRPAPGSPSCSPTRRTATASSRTWSRSTTSRCTCRSRSPTTSTSTPASTTRPTSGRIFRPDGEALTPNWKHLPIGYHGRAGTVVVSGTDVVRPSGQRKAPDRRRRPSSGRASASTSRPSSASSSAARPPSAPGVASARPTSTSSASSCSTTGAPATSRPGSTCRSGRSSASPSPPASPPGSCRSTPWRRPGSPCPGQDPRAAALPAGRRRRGVRPGHPLRGASSTARSCSRPEYRDMYWSPAQMLAHLTVNGASLRNGDLFGSGTISRPETRTRGCLLELTWNGTEPLTLDDGTHPQLPRGRRRRHPARLGARPGRHPHRPRRGHRAHRPGCGLEADGLDAGSAGRAVSQRPAVGAAVRPGACPPRSSWP